MPSTTASQDSLPAHLTSTAACYILLRRRPDGGLVALTYVPDTAPVRQKTLYASTRLTLVRALGTQHFADTALVSSAKEVLAALEHRQDAAASESAARQQLMTEEERSLAAVRAVEARESAGLAGRKAHVSSGVGFPVDRDAVDALAELGRGGGENLVQLVGRGSDSHERCPVLSCRD